MAIQKIIYRYEDLTAGNKSSSTIFEVEAEDCAIMIDCDRALRAQELGVSPEQVEPRSVQEIVDAHWRVEENNAHRTFRSDGRKTAGGYCSLEAVTEGGAVQIADSAFLSPEEALIETEEIQERKAQYAQMKAALSELTDKQRQIITWIDLEDKTVTEVAGLLGVSKAAVSKLRKKALEKLRVLLGVNNAHLSGSASERSTNKSFSNTCEHEQKGW